MEQGPYRTAHRDQAGAPLARPDVRDAALPLAALVIVLVLLAPPITFGLLTLAVSAPPEIGGARPEDRQAAMLAHERSAPVHERTAR